MVEIGNLEIVGTIDTAQIDAGLLRMRGSLRQVSDSTKPVQADFDRIAGSLGKMSLAFVGLGAVGVGLFASLSRDAPALAGAFARASVATAELKRSLGREFQGAADASVGAFERLVDLVQSLEGTGILGGAIIGGGIGAAGGGAAGGIIGGPFGAAAGAGIGGLAGAAFGAGVGSGILNPGLGLGFTPRGFQNPFGIIGSVVAGFLSKEGDRKFNLFNIIDSVFG